jgi:hypothetical protein
MRYIISDIARPLMSLGLFPECSEEKVLPYWLSNPPIFLPDRVCKVNYGVFQFLRMTPPIAQWCQPLIRFTRPIEFNQQITSIIQSEKIMKSELRIIQTQSRGYLPLIGFVAPSAFLTSGNLLTLSLPSSVWSTYRFSQPFSGLLRPDAYRPYFMSNPLVGFHPSEFFPSKNSERLSTPRLPS